jgi:hypothetical protein
MKYSIFVLLALSFYSCSDANSQIEKKLHIQTFLKGVYDIPRHQDTAGIRIFLIGLKLKNISDNPVEFLTMTCTTGSNLVFDSNQLKPVVNNCASNYITPIILDPQQEFDFAFLLRTVDSYTADSYPDSLKIGWVLLTKENTHSADKYFDYLVKFSENLENVIWANPIDLNCCDFRQFEIK